jgi:hypothetical protein
MRVRLEDDIVHVDETAVASSELLLNLRNRVDDAGLVPVALSAFNFNSLLHGAADVQSLKSVMVGAQVRAQRCHKLQALLHMAFTALRSRCIELHTCTCALTCSQSELNVRRMWLNRLRAL